MKTLTENDIYRIEHKMLRTMCHAFNPEVAAELGDLAIWMQGVKDTIDAVLEEMCAPYPEKTIPADDLLALLHEQRDDAMRSPETGLKEPVVLQRIINEVHGMAANAEIKARIEREDANGRDKDRDTGDTALE